MTDPCDPTNNLRLSRIIYTYIYIHSFALDYYPTCRPAGSISRMERLVLCACVGPQRTLDAPGEGAIFGPKARRMKAVSFARPGNFAFLVSLF